MQVSTARPNQERARQTERVPLMCSKQWLDQVDTWRFENRVPSRAKAIRMLAERGLNAKGPAEGATSPSHGSSNPHEENAYEQAT